MNATPRERAIRSLERWLGRTHPHESDGLLNYYRGLVTALLNLGLLDTGEHADWIARFQAATQPLEPPGEDLHARAVELLERELAGAAKPADADGVLGGQERFRTKLQALLESGIVGWDERAGLIEKLDKVAPETSPSPAAPPYRLEKLRAVVVGPKHTIDGLRVTSTELYDDCTIVRWHLVIDGDEAWRGRVAVPDRGNDLIEAHGPTALTDDLGTAYAIQATGHVTRLDVLQLHEHTEVLRGSSAFTPATPPQATRLAISLPAGEVPLALHDRT